MGVMVTAVCSDLFQRTALANLSIAGDVEMVTNVTEPAVLDMILSASLRRKEFSFRRGTAMISKMKRKIIIVNNEDNIKRK